MKKIYATILLMAGAMCFSSVDAAPRIVLGGGKKPAPPKEYPSLKPLLDRSINQYPEDVKLLENEQFVSRLIDLVGELRVEYMRKNFDFEYPIENIGKSYSIMACKSQMCGTTDFEIQYFPDINVLCAKYTLEGVTEEFKERPDVRVEWTTYSNEEDFGY